MVVCAFSTSGLVLGFAEFHYMSIPLADDAASDFIDIWFGFEVLSKDAELRGALSALEVDSNDVRWFEIEGLWQFSGG